ncbi:MAG: DUF4397 domain-containing protein [Xanthomonadales bacterium]|jgi:hypothetical protein|nr:DUF4397 domain-containing protein [Xanthomonadales bacterium]
MKRLLATALFSGLTLTSTAWAQVRVSVGHFAPFANTVAGTSVDIRVNGTTALTGVRFGQFTGYLNLGAAGRYTVEVIPSGSTQPAITGAFDLGNGDFSLYAVGDGSNQPLALLPLNDDNTPPSSGRVKLRVVHAAPFASGLPATAVSVRDAQNRVVADLGNVQFRQSSPYFQIDAGRVDLKISTPDGTTTLIDPRPATLAAGGVITLVAIGGRNLPLGVTAVTESAAPANPLPLFTIGPVRARVAHFAPFAATLDATAVRVRVNGNEVLSGVRYGDFSGLLNLSGQGAYEVEVFAGNATTPAIRQTVELDGGQDHIVAAVGNGLTQPLGLLSAAEDPTPAAAGRYALRIVHAAPFAASADATRVSIRSDGGAVIAGLSSVPFGAASGVLDLPIGPLDVKIATPDGGRNLIDPATLNIPSGARVTAFAVGDGINQPLGVIAVPVGALPLEAPVDLRANGHWFDPRTPGQGFSIIPRPVENRLIATWYTFGPDGGQRWYLLDSCRSAPGADSCAQPGGFDNRNSTVTIYESTGGRLNATDPTTLRVVGSGNFNFESCTAGRFEYQFTNGPSATVSLSNLVPNPDCRP